MKIGKKRAVILCNGRPPTKSQISRVLEEADLFIAADGGGNRARQLNITPDVVIGDLDSYRQSGSEDFPVIKNPDQNTNDLEKALNYALKHQHTDVTVFGATGFRVDQTLKNLSVLKQFHEHFNSLHFLDEYCKTFLIESPYRNKFPLHTRVSLFPLSGTVSGITSKGLKYELQSDTLKNGVFDGSSNETVEPIVKIEFEAGDLILIINHTEETET